MATKRLRQLRNSIPTLRAFASPRETLFPPIKNIRIMGLTPATHTGRNRHCSLPRHRRRRQKLVLLMWLQYYLKCYNIQGLTPLTALMGDPVYRLREL
jgi:hypothetical protein